MRLSDFLNFYRATIVGKITFQQFKAAYQTFDPDMFYADCLATNADKLKAMTRQHGTIESMSDAILGKAFHFWGLSYHLMYRPSLETMRDAVDRRQGEVTQEQFISYIKSKQGAMNERV